MEEQSLEDILEEAKQEEFKRRFDKVNKKLWLWISLFLGIEIIGLIVLGTSDLDAFIQGFIILILLLPLTIGFFSMFIGMIPFIDWNYEDRVYRVFLILFLIIESIIMLIAIVAFLSVTLSV